MRKFIVLCLFLLLFLNVSLTSSAEYIESDFELPMGIQFGDNWLTIRKKADALGINYELVESFYSINLPGSVDMKIPGTHVDANGFILDIDIRKGLRVLSAFLSLPDYQYYGEDKEFDTIYSQMKLAFGLSIQDGWQTKAKDSPEISRLLVTPLDIEHDDSLIAKLPWEVEAKYSKEAFWLIRDSNAGVSIQLKRLETTDEGWTEKVTIVTFIHHNANELEELFEKLFD